MAVEREFMDRKFPLGVYTMKKIEQLIFYMIFVLDISPLPLHTGTYK